VDFFAKLGIELNKDHNTEVVSSRNSPMEVSHTLDAKKLRNDLADLKISSRNRSSLKSHGKV
jgi:hypothetical protein